MTRLDELLECDLENPAESCKALTDIEPCALEAVGACQSALAGLRDEFSQVSGYDDYHRFVEDWAAQHGLQGTKALQLLRGAIVVGEGGSEDSTDEAKEKQEAAVCILARAHLSLRFERDFFFGITDLLRLRITAALGYLRPQSETVGQMKLLTVCPDLGEDWFASAGDSEGKSFHGKWHSRVVDVIKDFGIHEDYSRASNMALHARASGTALGILLGAKKGAPHGELRLVFQETENPALLFFWFGVILAFYRKVLTRAQDLYPELDKEALRRSGVEEFLALERLVCRRAEKAREHLRKNGMVVDS